MNEREFIANVRLAGQVVQDVLTPALTEHFNNEVYKLKRQLDEPMRDLQTKLHNQELRIDELAKQIEVLKASMIAYVVDHIDVGL